MSFQLLPVLGRESCFEKRGVEHLGAAGMGLSEELWTMGAFSRQTHLLWGAEEPGSARRPRFPFFSLVQ